jgi:hypothetical protein
MINGCFQCKECRFWDDSVSTGKCRRFPPVAYKARAVGSTYGLWPTTNEDDWCGDGASMTYSVCGEKRTVKKRRS